MSLPALKSVSCVLRYAEAPIPTARGDARLIVYRECVDGAPMPHQEHVAMVFGDPQAATDGLLARVHSECITSEVFGSLKCDCRQQLDDALDRVAAEGTGVLLYLRQEGRGIGLGNKVRAYALQAEGADTIEANHQLGFGTDLRSYDIAAEMLRDLGVGRVRLMTNNPEKVSGLEDQGIEVVRREPIEIAPNRFSRDYLATKKRQMGHLLGAFGLDER